MAKIVFLSLLLKSDAKHTSPFEAMVDTYSTYRLDRNG